MNGEIALKNDSWKPVPGVYRFSPKYVSNGSPAGVVTCWLPDMYWVSPFKKKRVPNVVISEGTRSLTVTRPLNRPTSTPARTASTNPTTRGKPGIDSIGPQKMKIGKWMPFTAKYMMNGATPNVFATERS